MVMALEAQIGANRRTERLKAMSFLLIFNDLRIDNYQQLLPRMGSYRM